MNYRLAADCNLAALELLTISPMAVSEELVSVFLSTPGYGVSTGVDRPIWVSRFLRSEHSSFHCLMAGIAVALSLILALLFRLENISVINLHLVASVAQCTFPLCILGIYCHWAKSVKLRDGCFLIAWCPLLVKVLDLPTYAAARTAFPFRDVFLVRTDALLGINVGSIVAWTHRHPSFETFSIRSYGLMPWLLFAAILIPAMGGRLTRAKEFLLATVLAALLASCILAVFPAVGPWVGFHFHPYWNQAWYAHELNALRTNGHFTANPDYTCGLITFPSFHVALAVLSAFALWPFRWLRAPALLVAALITVATVTTGWHYASDGIGGMLIAWVGISVARRSLGSFPPDYFATP